MLRDENNPKGPAVRLDVKVVPGARRDEIAGVLGERLKIRVAAPPEDGRANKAVCALIAKALGIRASEVTVIAGPASPEKTLRIAGKRAQDIRAALGL
ncbi:MAG: DUF167 domain-containing protein [Phycisphaerales bacterium]|nr:DUF167 domain-containing protein [Phycisphaerales bacterium]